MKCDVCGAKVSELRRGRCWGCYNRWVESRPVGLGASCTMCTDRRRENLKSVELLGSWLPVCHNCAARATQLDPLPQTIAEIRATLARDRRNERRRLGKKDTRVFKRDRRGDDRRRVRRLATDDPVVIEDEMIVEIEELSSELAGDAGDGDGDDLTRIRELPLSVD